MLNITNFTSIPCNLTENPWCGQLGAQQVIEVVCLATISIVGTFGNLLVITSITYLGRKYENGNIFLINLAFADLLVTAVCLPACIANVFKGGKALSDSFCEFVAYLMLSSTACSLTNVACIAANRYWFIVRYASYRKVFSKRNIRLMILCCWIYANLLMASAVWSGIGLQYDKASMICMWNRKASTVYNFCLSAFSILVPSVAVGVFYWKLYEFVHAKGKALRRHSFSSTGSRMEQRSIEKEVALLKTLAVTVMVFYFCWIPGGIIVTTDKLGAPIAVQKYLVWLCLSNSSVNFIIYGVTNRDYRRKYEKLLKKLFLCKKDLFRSQWNTNSISASGITAHSKQPEILLSSSCQQIPSTGNEKVEQVHIKSNLANNVEIYP